MEKINVDFINKLIYKYLGSKQIAEIEKILAQNNVQMTSFLASLKEVQKKLAEDLYKISISDELENDSLLLQNIHELKKQVKLISSNINETSELQLRLTKASVDPVHIYLSKYENECSVCDENNTIESLKYYSYLDENGETVWDKVKTAYCPECDTHNITYKKLKQTRLQESNVILKHGSMWADDENVEFFDNIDDLIVISNIENCIREKHTLTDLSGIILLIDENGSIEPEYIPITYCEDCNRYTMLKENYERLNGIPACKIIDETSFYSQNNDNDFLGSASELNQLGYNVNYIDNLSDAQRQTILALQIESGKMTRSEIGSYISFQVDKFKSRKNCERAVARWRRDLEFIDNYNKDANIIVDNIKNIILKYHMKL
ncbi:MAG: hypothetical protein SPF99_05185 [Anaerobutyricum sp.]|nr:hypothetical protein [Anaerobutyricum sp.]